MGYRVAGTLSSMNGSNNISIFPTSCPEDLSSKKRYKEAAHVLLDYCKDIRDTVIALTTGNMFSEARRIVSRPLRCTYYCF
jgi:hypothetical protein